MPISEVEFIDTRVLRVGDLEKRLATLPTISVPTVSIDC